MTHSKPTVGRRSVTPVRLTDDDRRSFGKILVLSNVGRLDIPVGSEGTGQVANDLIIDLLASGLVCQTEDARGHRYSLTDAGIEQLQELAERNFEFVCAYQVYRHVDTEAGEFAMAGFFELGGHLDSQEWADYVEDERWWDLRMALAYYKGLEPVDVALLLLAFDDECEPIRFESHEQLFEALELGAVWDKVEDIVNSQPVWEELCGTRRLDANEPFTDEEVESARRVAETVLEQGASLLRDLLEQEAALTELEEPVGDQTDDVGEEVVTQETTEVHEDNAMLPYSEDPYYVSPLWDTRLAIYL